MFLIIVTLSAASGLGFQLQGGATSTSGGFALG